MKILGIAVLMLIVKLGLLIGYFGSSKVASSPLLKSSQNGIHVHIHGQQSEISSDAYHHKYYDNFY